MDLLQQLISVSLTQESLGVCSSPALPDGLVPRQPLRMRLCIQLNNAYGQLDSTIESFLATVGERDIEEVWNQLFQRVAVATFMVDRRSAARGMKMGQAQQSPIHAVAGGEPTAAKTWYVYGEPAFWRKRRCDRSHSRAGAAAATPSPAMRPSSPSSQRRQSLCLRTGRCLELSDGQTDVVPRDIQSNVVDDSVTVQEAAHSTRGAIPASIMTTFFFDCTVPDVGEDLDGGMTLAFVLLLPLLPSPVTSKGISCATLQPPRFNCTTSLPSLSIISGDGKRPVLSCTLMDALAHSFQRCSGDVVPPWYSLQAIPLGCCYVPLIIKRALQCQTSSHTLGNGRLAISVHLSNESHTPVRLLNATFDLFATQVGREGKLEAGGLNTLWCTEQRPGSYGADVRAVDILRKVVTVTPVIVGHTRPPLVLHPGEIYVFQFVLQLLPQLSYLLNPRSLEYVYKARRNGEGPPTATSEGAVCSPSGGSSGMQDALTSCKPAKYSQLPQVVVPAGVSSDRSETAIRDMDGNLVSPSCILQVLDAKFVSKVYIYYDWCTQEEIYTGKTSSGIEKNRVPSELGGLHLQHAVHWFFGTTQNGGP